MPLSLGKLHLVLILLSISYCEEWYEPNSRMISQQQFKENILNDQTTYKLVKFFIPNCRYCRFLKEVVDQLKEEKKWSFQIYDFNCAWYPAVCNEIKAYSFPFIGIFNEAGHLDDQIVGFYPYPVMKDYFDKLEIQTLEFKQKGNNIVQDSPQEPQLKVENEVKAQQRPTEPIEVRKAPIQENHEIIAQQPQIKSQPKVIQDQKLIPKQDEQILSQKAEQKPREESVQSHLSSPFQHIFYSICILIGVVYFGSFLNLIKTPQKNPHPVNNPEPMSDHLQTKFPQYPIKLPQSN